ncbi:cyclin-dependent kinase F-4-like protein isoform X1, partial [Tanacetum coccineum]
ALCSWDPSKRPTAVEALQHPFFQSCYYIPPSLRSKAATARMSPSVGLNGRGAIEHNYATGYSVFLPNVKPENNVISSAKVPTFASIGVYHKMEVNHQSGVTNEKLYQTAAREPKYQPIGKYNTKQQTSGEYTPPVKAGIRNGRSELFYVKSRDIQHGNGRAYCSKVAG